MARHKLIRTNKHHRLSRSRSGGTPFDGQINGVPNVQLVNYKQHNAFHILFPDTHPKTIAWDLNNRWIDPNYIMVAIPFHHARKLKKLLKQL